MTDIKTRKAFPQTISKKGAPNDITTLSELILTIDSVNNIGADATAFQTNVTGSNNLAIGVDAGASVVTNTDSSFFGANTNATDGLSNVTAIGANATVTTDNTVALGSSADVVIGATGAITGLTLGADAPSSPAIYMSESPDLTATTIAANDGIYSVRAGQPTFTNAVGEKTLLSLSVIESGAPSATVGQTLNGTVGVAVAAPNVTADSIVIVTRNNMSGNAPSIVDTGNLTVGNVVPGTGFTVYSTVATDVAPFNWLVIKQ